MIKKALIIGLILSLIYSFFIAKFSLTWNTAQYDLQENIIKSQSYTLDDKNYESVIVGSSLSARLDLTNIQSIYNLSMAGGSLFDGLNIIQQKKQLPQKVYIEINVAERPENEMLIESIKNPVSSVIKKNVPITREEYQPVGVLISYIFYRLEGKNAVHKKDDAVLQKLVQEEIVQNQKNMDSIAINKNFKNLKMAIQKLEKQGVKIIFFEIPVNEKVCGLAKPSQIRNAFFANFPVSKYKYILQPNCTGYQTTDGKHLAPEEVQKYMKYFTSNI
jgi:hypothetical protein